MIYRCDFSALSPTQHIIISLASVTAITFGIAVLSKSTRNKEKDPPYTSDSISETILGMTSPHAPFFMETRAKTYGLVFRLFLPIWDTWYIVCDPALARLVFEGDSSLSIKASDKPPHVMDRFSAVTDNIPFLFSKQTDGGNWEIPRKGLAPSFSQINLNKRMIQFQEKANEFCSILDKHVANDIILEDISEWLVKLTIDFISTSMFDRDFKCLSGEMDPDVKEFVKELPFAEREVFSKQAINPLRPLMFWNKDVKRLKKSAKGFIKMAKNMLDEHRKKLIAWEASGHRDDGSMLLSRMISTSYISEDERAADVIGFLIAGHDTTAYQLSFIILEICKDKRVREKLQSELDSVITSPLEPITHDHITQLTYLSYVVKEVMRLFPVAAQGSVRKAFQDIETDKYIIYKGCTILIPMYAMFRSATTIREPTSFIPERWEAGDSEEKQLQELMMPFALGKRNCIGQNLAKMEIHMLTAMLFRRYNFELVSEVYYDYFLVLRPINANLKVTSRLK
mmetsp:Transcript_18204/g.18263  ORF Transcript_18204/g.18263 Transcript_18204/m.18263 type:complete len:511 (+) Transcript_18204:77-1609(+)